MADNPWHFQLYSDKGEAKSAQAQYDTMTFEQMKKMNVGHLADKNCMLFFWTTWPLLLGNSNYPVDGISKHQHDMGASYSPAGDVIRSWGFNYVTGGAWLKKTVNGHDQFGTGYRARSACEPWLLATNGNPVNSKRHRNFFEGLAREHSRKPECAYEWAETYMPNAKRLDLFSRQKREGWDSFGNEGDKFEAAPD